MSRRRKQPRRHRPTRPARHAGRTRGGSSVAPGSDDLITTFGGWLTDLGLEATVPEATSVAEVMLEYRRERPGDALAWSVDDVDHFLLVACPERLQLAELGLKSSAEGVRLDVPEIQL